MERNLKKLRDNFDGDLCFDDLTRVVYATDASAYREIPLGVAFPKTKQDIRELIAFANKTGISLIPRGAGTSLAGQVVGNGLVVDISRYFNSILEFNKEERWIRVEPGIVLDELNNSLRPYNLFFAPETSTSNRCTIGGMVGNNSCGSHSLVYGSVREHLIETTLYLANNEEITLKELTETEFEDKISLNSLEGKIYKYIKERYSKSELRKKIHKSFPEKDIKRRNNGYALDEIINNNIFEKGNENRINLSKIFAGSEGTLGFATEFKLNLMPLPPREKALICIHFYALEDCFEGNLIALRHQPMAVELMDNNILEAAKRNIEQQKNSFFVVENPQAILIIELAEESQELLNEKINRIIEEFKTENKGYAFPVIRGENIPKVWALRKAGLGLLTNIAGSAKPVSVIEDTAVSPQKLKNYMKEFQVILSKYKLKCVYHAHIATGELHLRPILDLKKEEDIELFRTLSREVAELVKKYRGSLSGEHGDGRLRGEFIPLMYGDEVYQLMKEWKRTWDRDNIFNRGKIISTPLMNTSLRYSNELEQKRKVKNSIFRRYIFKRYEPNRLNDLPLYYNFSDQKGILAAVEQCNGSADCRKSAAFLGTMCPSYRATNNELFSPRARANALREYLTNPKNKNPFDCDELYWILDNCLSCKACKSECPSNIDIAKFKSEFLQHYYHINGTPIRIILITYLTLFQRIGSLSPKLYNWVITNQMTSNLIKSILHFSKKRSLPTLNEKTLRQSFKQENSSQLTPSNEDKRVYIFADEFTNYQDSHIGICFLKLLNSFGYRVEIAPIRESGRISMSKGMAKRAKRLANKNINKLKGIIGDNAPLVGIEPSTILSFRDEYPSLLSPKNKTKEADIIIKNTLLFDEFISKEIDKGNIKPEHFTAKPRHILLHGHCQQKALIGTKSMEKALSLPRNYSVETLETGCCGMAGSFGYEEKHYQMSENIGRQILFPSVLKADKETIISAPGTSCREHIKHFTKKETLHPIEVLWSARGQ